MKRAPLAAALALAMLAGVGVYGALLIPAGFSTTGIDARAFPVVLAGGLALLALVVLVQAVRGRIPDEADNTEEPPLEGGLARVGWMLGGIVCAPLALYLFGFLIGGVVGFTTVARAFGAKHWGVIIGFGFAATLVTWVLFDKLLTLKLGSALVRLPF